MYNSKYVLSILFVAVFLGFSAFEVMFHWKIRDNYAIKFTHEDADGVFKKFDGKIIFDPAEPDKASFDVAIDIKSVETGNPMRNESIMGDNWMSADKYPKVTFKAEGAKKSADRWVTSGVLNMHGVEQAFELPFTFVSKQGEATFETSFTFKMMDFKLSTDPGELMQMDIKIPVSK